MYTFQSPDKTAGSGSPSAQCGSAFGGNRPEESRPLPHLPDAEPGRGSKGIPLYMVDSQRIIAEVIAAPQIFVGGITFMIDGAQLAP